MLLPPALQPPGSLNQLCPCPSALLHHYLTTHPTEVLDALLAATTSTPNQEPIFGAADGEAASDSSGLNFPKGFFTLHSYHLSGWPGCPLSPQCLYAVGV